MRHHRLSIPLLACGAAFALFVGISAALPVDNAAGRQIFEKRCTGCHTLDQARVGPPLRHVFGRRAASDPKYPYSDALRVAQFSWDAANLDRWLADPDAVVPGNDMTFRLENATERSAIIAYLSSLER